MFDVRITVAKITRHNDLIERYEMPIGNACDMREGKVFISKDGQCPSEFCDSAWDTISPFVTALAAGGGKFYGDWMKNPYSAMISCNDGFRPVSFLLERMDN